MRISDWSSDVCSSDLPPRLRHATNRPSSHPPHEGSPVTIPQPFVSLSHLIDMNASARPFDIAWSDARDEYTWRQFADDVNTNANTLADLGLVKGDIVAMLADSSDRKSTRLNSSH